MVKVAWGNWMKCSGGLYDRTIPVTMRGKIVYGIMVRSAHLYGSETRATTKGQERRLMVNERRTLRWMCEVSEKDTIRKEHVRGLVNVESMAKKIRKKRLKWYGHVMRRDEEEGCRFVAAYRIPSLPLRCRTS